MPKTSSSADSGAGSPCPHTPGPWQVLPPGKAQSPWIVADIEGGSIADCEPCGPWMPDQVATANARLIAAAPELLDALKVAYEMLGQMIAAMNSASGGHVFLTGDYPQIQQIIAVIAKVEGADVR
jgi:hypothetical protein